MDIVRAAAHRSLRRMKRYVAFTGTQDRIPDWLVTADTAEGERILGWYTNGPNPAESVVVTTHGVRFGDGWRIVKYGDIQRVPLRSKADRSVHLLLGDGGTVTLPILGGDGKLRDALAFMGFLNSVIAGEKKQPQSEQR